MQRVSGGSLAWAIMARSLFSRLGTACLLYLYVINVIYLVPNKAGKKDKKKTDIPLFMYDLSMHKIEVPTAVSGFR